MIVMQWVPLPKSFVSFSKVLGGAQHQPTVLDSPISVKLVDMVNCRQVDFVATSAGGVRFVNVR
jgi:hypothetical protein